MLTVCVCVCCEQVLWAFVVLLVAALVYRCSGAAKLDADAAKRH